MATRGPSWPFAVAISDAGIEALVRNGVTVVRRPCGDACKKWTRHDELNGGGCWIQYFGETRKRASWRCQENHVQKVTARPEGHRPSRIEMSKRRYGDVCSPKKREAAEDWVMMNHMVREAKDWGFRASIYRFGCTSRELFFQTSATEREKTPSTASITCSNPPIPAGRELTNRTATDLTCSVQRTATITVQTHLGNGNIKQAGQYVGVRDHFHATPHATSPKTCRNYRHLPM